MITLTGIANRDKRRRTRKWLDSQGMDYEFHDYPRQGVSDRLRLLGYDTAPMQALLN